MNEPLRETTFTLSSAIPMGAANAALRARSARHLSAPFESGLLTSHEDAEDRARSFFAAEADRAFASRNWDRWHAARKLISERENELMVFPAAPSGIWVEPIIGGMRAWVFVAIDRETARVCERQRRLIEDKGAVPYFDLGHLDDAVTFFPSRFFFRSDGVVPGVYANGTFTDEGRTAVDRGFRYVSPKFMTCEGVFPTRVVCDPDSDANMGALVLKPAFDNLANW